MIISLLLSLLIDVTINPISVRYGNLSEFKEGDAVAVVDSKKVYQSFEEYRIIVKEGIKQGTARYTQLMSECTKKYRKVLKKCAVNKYVLVVEVGGISKGYPTTNITDALIESKGL